MYLHDLVFLAGAVGISWTLLRRFARAPLRRAVVEGVFASYLVGVAYVVFSVGRWGRIEAAYSWQQVNLVPLRTILEFARSGHGAHALRQLAGNVVLFVPFGALLPVLTPRVRAVAPLLLAAVTASASIELFQLLLGLLGLAGRSVDIDDVILNTVGGLVGWVLWRGASRGPKPSSDEEAVRAGA